MSRKTSQMLISELGKTHRGLINAFSAHLVKDGLVPREMGRLLKRAEEIRLVADYNGESVEVADAEQLVAQSRLFVSAMSDLFMSGPA